MVGQAQEADAGAPRDGLPRVTVGILTYQRAWSLPRVLSALEALDYDKGSMRLVFVDRNSTDGTREIVGRFASRVERMYESVQVVESDAGISGARNECIDRAAGTDYLFFLDSDVVAGPETLKRLLPHLGDGTVGIASLPYDSDNSRGKLGPLVNAFVTPAGAADSWKVAAGCTLISLRAAEKVGPFNEKLRVLEDGEYCYRAKRAGYRVVCDFGYPAAHLKTIKMGPSSYLGFARDSADFYVEMVKRGSAIYAARYILSVTLVAAAVAALVTLSVWGAVAFLLILALSAGVNSSDRLWGDGSKIKPYYKPLVGLVFTAATILVSAYSLAKVFRRSPPS